VKEKVKRGSLQDWGPGCRVIRATEALEKKGGKSLSPRLVFASQKIRGVHINGGRREIDLGVRKNPGAQKALKTRGGSAKEERQSDRARMGSQEKKTTAVPLRALKPTCDSKGDTTVINLQVRESKSKSKE